MKRILFVLTAAALLVAMVGASAVPAMAQVNLDNNNNNAGVFDDDDDNGIFDDDGDDDGDEIDDVDVEEAFFDGDDVCVLVVTEFEDGSTDVDEECVDVGEASFV
jgi:hypothetical protein